LLNTHLSCYANLSFYANLCHTYLVISCHRAGASDLPHSRHEVLDRDVINPQKGHIRCDAKPGAAGVIDANSFKTVAVMEATRLRKRSRKRRRARSISDSFSLFLPM
jgi:hypothetical protein